MKNSPFSQKVVSLAGGTFCEKGNFFSRELFVIRGTFSGELLFAGGTFPRELFLKKNLFSGEVFVKKNPAREFFL